MRFGFFFVVDSQMAWNKDHGDVFPIAVLSNSRPLVRTVGLDVYSLGCGDVATPSKSVKTAMWSTAWVCFIATN